MAVDQSDCLILCKCILTSVISRFVTLKNTCCQVVKCRMISLLIGALMVTMQQCSLMDRYVFTCSTCEMIILCHLFRLVVAKHTPWGQVLI